MTYSRRRRDSSYILKIPKVRDTITISKEYREDKEYINGGYNDGEHDD